jgi:FKBP-type peptidyl-prolyl cis-trans isomerase
MRFVSSSVILLLAIALVGCNQGGGSGATAAPTTLEERASYALGFSAGEQLSTQAQDLDIDQLVAGLRDAFAGETGHMTAEEIQNTMMEYQQATMAAEEERLSSEGAENKAAGDAFLAENAGKEGVMVTESGLQYEVIEEGDGASPGASDQVTVHYEGRLIDGTVFDSSYEKGEPVTFPLNRVIPGWTEGVQLMNVGSKYRFFIPGELGYGLRPPPGEIGPNDTLIFEVELLQVNGQS